MTYEQFKINIANKQKMPDSVYYSSIIKHRQNIMDEISMTNQHTVATSLGMSQAKLSTMTKLLRYIDG